jgi:shikimate dehydrogenase
LAALGLNWRYLAFEVHPENLRQAIAGAKAMNFVGLNLTVPHKLLALDMVDHLDQSARLWGAVNTIRFEGQDAAGTWKPLVDFSDAPQVIRTHGFNTDADAMVRAISEDLNLSLPGARVLVLGAGGAGRTAALKLACSNVAELFLVNRTSAKAESVAREIRKLSPSTKLTLGYPEGSVDLLLNATSVGLKPTDGLPFAPTAFSLQQAPAVYDMIYRPAETPLLRAARAAGCQTANGLSMLLYQGAKALEIWSGKIAPLEIMHRALKQNVYGA